MQRSRRWYRRDVRENEVMRGEMEGAADLVAAATEGDVFDLEETDHAVSFLFCLG